MTDKIIAQTGIASQDLQPALDALKENMQIISILPNIKVVLSTHESPLGQYQQSNINIPIEIKTTYIIVYRIIEDTDPYNR